MLNCVLRVLLQLSYKSSEKYLRSRDKLYINKLTHPSIRRKMVFWNKAILSTITITSISGTFLANINRLYLITLSLSEYSFILQPNNRGSLEVYNIHFVPSILCSNSDRWPANFFFRIFAVEIIIPFFEISFKESTYRFGSSFANK